MEDQILTTLRHLLNIKGDEDAESGSDDSTTVVTGAEGSEKGSGGKFSESSFAPRLRHVSSGLFKLLMELLSSNPKARKKLLKELEHNLSSDPDLQKILHLLAKHAHENTNAKEALFEVLDHSAGQSQTLALQIVGQAGGASLIEEWKQAPSLQAQTTAPTPKPMPNPGSIDPFEQ